MNETIIALVGYMIAIPLPASVIAWGVARRAGRLPSATAMVVAAGAFFAMVAPPLAGFAINAARDSRVCGAGVECYDNILWRIAIPVGWILAAVVVGAAVLRGRATHRNGGDTAPWGDAGTGFTGKHP